MKHILLSAALASLICSPVFAASPVTINNAANTDSVAVTNHALNVNVSGSVGTQDTNLAQVNGQTVNVGTGAAGTGTQRVTTSTDSTIGTVTTITNPVAATQSGTWTVQPGNTANTTAWKVDGSAVTQPVSGTVTAAQATAANLNATVVGTGTFATQATLAAGSAIVGKVGIDQTTPGTTNGVQINAALPAGTNVIGHVISDTGSTTAVTQATAASLNATVVGTGTFATQSAQSGTWTVQPGNTANTTAWKVDGSAVTQPISAASLPLPTSASTAANQTAGQSPTAPATATATVSQLAGCTYTSAGVTFTNGQQGALSCGASGGLYVAGTVASGATDSGNPVKAGAVYNSTFPTFTTGQRGDVQIDSRGNLRMTITNGDGITPAVVSTSANTMALTGALRVSAIHMIYNGTTEDLAKSVVDATNTTGTGITAAGILGQFNDVSPQTITENQFGNVRVTATGEQVIAGQVSGGTTTKALQVDSNGVVATSAAAASTGGASFLNIAAGQATTTVKSGAGTLYAIVLNSAATATNTTTIYDNTAASGTVIGRPAVTTATVPTTLVFGPTGMAFATGLTIITATANGGDMTVIYK